MHHAPPLLVTLVAALSLAFALGAVARVLRQPPLVGYLLAGIVVGPYTPGFVADPQFTTAMAEVGVALLLFGVGLHFSFADLLAARRVAVPGALGQIAAGTLLGAALGAVALDLSAGPALVFGLALSISSSAVATRVLAERGLLGGEVGRIALGWLVVQDLVVVFALVLVAAAAGASSGEALLLAIGHAALELAGFGAVVLLVGRRFLPWALGKVARMGSPELFTLAVLVTALGTAFGAAALFNVSFALGAFFAGVLLGESDLGHQAAAETVPLQRVFAALFFVSVGMLLDPFAVAAAPLVSLASLACVLLGTGGAALAMLLALRVPAGRAATVAASLAQIGEFSFLLGGIAIARGVLPRDVLGPILVGGFGAILLSPLAFRLAHGAGARLARSPRLARWHDGARAGMADAETAHVTGHAIVIGHGRVGRVVAAALRRHGLPLVVVEQDRRVAEFLRTLGIPVVWGDATRPEVLHAARPDTARLVLVALPGAFEARRVIELARAANPAIEAAARAHDDAEMAVLAGDPTVGLVVMGERETALGMADFALRRLGLEADDAQRTVDAMRAGMPGGRG